MSATEELLAGSSISTAVRKSLYEVYDPCSQSWQRPLSIVDLGLVRSVSVDADGRAAVTISPTTLFCMAITVIIQAIELRVAAVSGISSVDVTVDVQTDWTPDMMTEHGRQVLAEHRATDRSKVLLSPTFGPPVTEGLLAGPSISTERSAACPR